MFASGMDSARETGGMAGGGVLIPVTFTWPHGGKTVHLTGSFGRWCETMQMSQLEGCPNVFQVVWSLPPGYHQYKFFVDGEWQHDEQQPFATSEYGIVNTLVLATEPTYIPPSPVTSTSTSNMEVDNNAFRHMPNQPISSIPEDIHASQNRISLFLSTHTAYELLPESGKVVALDVDLPVKQAFHILYEQGIPIAPLWEFSKGQFVGVLSALDFILILREVRPYDNLKDVALKILQNGVATVPVIHSSSEDGSFPQLLHLASLSGVLKCLCRYFKHSSGSLRILQLPICAIPIGTWVPSIGELNNHRPLAMLRHSATLSSALNLLVEAEVSSVPIVDDNDSLLDIYCRSDITALAKDRAYTHINLSQMTIQEALQLGQDSHSSYEMRSQRCQMCLRTDSLLKVIERLANPGVRRLVVVEAGSKRVEGIITLSDIFRFFLG
ncbi:hypothetical protein SLEP1_g40217 [Rubroshorea leprosula]|uniref:CBS domain-containing protein n=1 Tax=Rubroshorea leprosula TaxID=152421 RepID=A0AAV5L338_9ROSI|nr:hypothetical protein SLEP1_g40217 [Rubroshorea leprosula]